MSERIKQWPGKALDAKDVEERRIITIRGRPEAKYAWSAGIAIGKFLNELKNGKIVARKCRKCGRILVPPRMFCELCFRPTDEWTYVKDTGAVNTYSISYVAADVTRMKKPIIVAVIELDGASEGIGILHKLGEVNPDKVKFGMRVKAVWKPEGEREGSITDIKYFKPLEE